MAHKSTIAHKVEQGTIRLACRIPVALHREVKIEAVKRSTTIEGLVAQAIQQLLKQPKGLAA